MDPHTILRSGYSPTQGQRSIVDDPLSYIRRMHRKRAVLMFLVVALVLAFPGVIAVLLMDKLELHAAIDHWHGGRADPFFRYFTHLADGLVPTALAIAFLIFLGVRAFLMVGLSCGLSAIFVQVLKHTVFADCDRPAMFRSALGSMHWIADLDLNHHFSFPSGHATAAFSMCLAISVVIGRVGWAMALSLLASLLAFSRVYLSQHFTEDVLAGALLGSVTAACVYYWLYRSSFRERHWLGRGPVYFPNQ